MQLHIKTNEEILFKDFVFVSRHFPVGKRRGNKVLSAKTEDYVAQNASGGNDYNYCLKDHLGNNRSVIKAGTTAYGGTLQEINYYPFGMSMGMSNGQNRQPFKYTGMELDMQNGLNIYDYSARGYDQTRGQFMSIDPLCEKYYWISPYTYCLNNPVRYIDPTGMSTHTDSLGHVVAVYNNDDMGVYRHNISASTYDGSTLSVDGVTRMGETEYWDEFSPTYSDDGKGFTIQFGKSFNPIIAEMNDKAQGMNLVEIAQASKGGGLFDIKKNYVNVGALLNGKYVTSRSAGNFLAGYNAQGGTYMDWYFIRNFPEISGCTTYRRKSW